MDEANILNHSPVKGTLKNRKEREAIEKKKKKGMKEQVLAYQPKLFANELYEVKNHNSECY